MIAARLSAVWQVAGVAGAALCCYLASQSVAFERAALARIDRQIADTSGDIRRLTTEIGARGRMSQLERWNVQVLALQAPRPRQFVSDGVQLASLYGRGARPALPIDPAIAAGRGAVEKVAFAPPATDAAPAVAPPEPLLRAATYLRARPSALAPDAPPLVHAALKLAEAAPKAEPARRGSLLPDDIGALAAREGQAGKAGAQRGER